MALQAQTFKATDGKNIAFYHWQAAPSGTPKAVVQIAHGMAEHAARYDRFASFLVKNGIAVIANDHRGHGQTAGSPEQVGYFEEGNFWEKALGDMKSLFDIIKTELYPNKPVYLLGHSMGSFLVRHFISKYGQEVEGAILSGTAGDPGLLGKIGLTIAKTEALLKGRKNRSPLLNTLSFGKFNQPFRPSRTDFDWLSRDEKEVDKYVADPLCGAVFTTGFFIDLIRGINQINNAATFAATPRSLPILLAAGDKDPVGDMAKGVKEVYHHYQQAGLEKVTCQLYPGARHEILNEINREEVFNDFLRWMERIRN